MKGWQRILMDSITDPEELARYLPVDMAELKEITGRYPMRIPRSYLGLLQRPGDPIWLQCIPDRRELQNDLPVDPLHEERLSPVPGVIHRYPDRVVLLVSSVCAMYCRFCMRKRQVGGVGHPFDLDGACSYIASNPAIHDVVLSGGDPLLLDDDRLGEFLSRLRQIPHVRIIRIGTRVPVTLPERITPALCRLLKRFHPLYVNTHFNHPQEVTAAAATACAKLADVGIPLGNQTVLLKGVNDNPLLMRKLMETLLTIRVKPYYIHQMDLVCGTGHFRTPISTGLDIMTALRGHISGMANPHFVIDLPEGKGKVPVLPHYHRREGGGDLILRNYLGEEVNYPDFLG